MKVNNLFIRPILFLLLLTSFQTLSIGQESEVDIGYLKNSILITPLMAVIDDTKSSIYYKRYLIRNSSKFLNVRLGTELLSNVNHTYSTGFKEKMTSINFKLGIEYGVNYGKSTLYFGGEFSNSRYKMNGAMMYPNQDALFNSNEINIDETSSIRDESTLKILSIIGFLGFKYQIVNRINVGLESSIGYGRYNSELIYADPIFSFTKNSLEGSLSQLIPNRFIFLEFEF